MYIITISLLLFSNLFILITYAEETSSRRDTPRNFNRNYEDCVCFPGGQPLIPELMKPERHGMERLVIYLYRIANTNQITVYKPSPEKQDLIPNVPFTLGDVMKVVTTDTIASLFNINPYNVQSQDHADPIGLNIGTIQNVTPKPGFNEFSLFFSKPNDALLPNIESPTWNYLDQSQQPSTLWYPQMYPAQQPIDYLNSVQPKPNYIKFNIPSQQNPVSPGYTRGPNNPYIHPNDKKYFTPISLSQPNPPVQLLQPDVNRLLKYNEGEPAARGPKPNLTFDNWFNKQMKTFQDPQLAQNITSINNDELRKLVQKTLFENHIHIGATGIMTDESGAPINLEHLELRPILIGNPVKIQALQGNQRLTLPQNLPYLEGILITFDYPPKILGVIPLGKTYVSSPEQIIQAPNSPSIRHYQTPSGLTNTWSNTPESILTNVKIPIYADSSNNIWNPIISNGWQRRSQDDPKAKKLETPNSNKTVKTPKAQESTKSTHSSKILKSSEILKSPGLQKSEVTLRPSEPTKLSEALKKPPFESNPDSQSNSNHRRLEYNNNYKVLSSSSGIDYYQSAENNLIIKPKDSRSLQLPVSHNDSPGARDENSNAQLTITEFTGNPYSHLTITQLDDKSQTYSNSGAESSSPLLPVTEFTSKPEYHLTVTPLNGNLDTFSNSKSDNSNLIAQPINNYYRPPSSLNNSPVVLEPERFSNKLIVTPMGEKLEFNSNSDTSSNSNSGTAKLIAKPINNYYRPLSSLNNSPGVLEPESFSPKLIVTPLGDKLEFNSTSGKYSNSNSGSPNLIIKPIYKNEINHFFHPDIISPQLTVTPYNTKTDSKWNSDSNSASVFYPNHNDAAITNWQQKGDSHYMPSTIHKIEEFKSPSPDSHVTRVENQLKTSPDDKKPSWTSKQRDVLTMKHPSAPESEKLAPEVSISNNFVDTKSKNLVTSDSGGIENEKPNETTRRFSKPLFQGVLKSFIHMVLQNLIAGGSENTPQNGNETSVSVVKTEAVEDIDRPDYRIIGGSAATGSGSPLSNKGRSGII